MKLRTQIIFIAMLCGMMFLLASCKEAGSIGDYQSIPQLYKSCPGKCGEPLACEGQPVKVWGYLDKNNIFANAQSGGERDRFLIAEQLDSQGFGKGKVIEVYPSQVRDNRDLFDKLNNVDGTAKILVVGNVKGYDAPTNLSCQRLISLEIQGEESVNIQD
jgi:hypothetical protein